MLKKIILLGAIFLAFHSLTAQENIVKASIITGNSGLQYERSLFKHFSVIGQLGYSEVTTTVNKIDTKSDGLGYYLAARYYFSSKKDLKLGG